MAKRAVTIFREITEDDKIKTRVSDVIVDIPDKADADIVKMLLEWTGRYKEDDWKYAYRLAFEEDWSDDVYRSVKYSYESAAEASYESGSSSIATCNIFSFEDMHDSLGRTTRITLRVSVGLHTMLTAASKDKSLNTFCVEALSKAVGYDKLVDATSATKG